MCNHTSTGPPHPASSPPRSPETSHCHWEVFSSRMNPGFHCTGQMADSVYGVVWVRFADVNVVDRVAHGGGGVMVWAGTCYGQRTQVHFIDAIFNAQRYRDEILRPILVPFIHDHHLMLQQDNARPHVARICTQFLEAENIPVLAWPEYSPYMSPIEHVWDALDTTTTCSSSCQYPATLHSHWRGVDQHSTINNLINSMRRRCVTPDAVWFSDFQQQIFQHNGYFCAE